MWRVITHWSTSTMAWPVRTSCPSAGYEMPIASLKESRSPSYLSDWASLYVVSFNKLILCTLYIHVYKFTALYEFWIYTEHMVKFILFFLCVFIRYKKNIKAFYIVHPTMFIRTVLIFFKPLIRSTLNTLHLHCKYTSVLCKDLLYVYSFYMHPLFSCSTFKYILNILHKSRLGLTDVCVVHSFKFGRKVHYVNYLSELEEIVKCDQLVIPSRVRA